MGLIAGLSSISLIELVVFLLNTVVNKILPRIRPSVHPIAKQRPKKVFLEVNKKKISMFLAVFMQKSSIHGVSLVANEKKSKIERTFWLVTIILLSILSWYAIFDTMKSAELKPIMISIDEKLWSSSDVRKLVKS